MCFKQLYFTFRLLTECTLDSIVKVISLMFLSNTGIVTFTYCLFALESYNYEWWKWKVHIHMGIIKQVWRCYWYSFIESIWLFVSSWPLIYLLTCFARFWSILYALVVDYWFIHQSSSIHSPSRNLRYVIVVCRV